MCVDCMRMVQYEYALCNTTRGVKGYSELVTTKIEHGATEMVAPCSILYTDI